MDAKAQRAQIRGSMAGADMLCAAFEEKLAGMSASERSGAKRLVAAAESFVAATKELRAALQEIHDAMAELDA